MENPLSTMDRPLDASSLRRRRARRLLGWTLPVAALALLLALLQGWLRPSVERARLRTARVERGPIQATVTASGRVVPAREHVLACPIDTRLTRLLKAVGDVVEPGEAIVELDTHEAALALMRLEEQVSLTENERRQAGLDLEQSLIDLEGRREIKTVELRGLELELERAEQHFAIGGISRATLEAAQVAVERARLELKQITQALANARARSEARLEELDLELRIRRGERDEARRRLELATARADARGVITWLPDREGAALRRGDELARIADLSAFRVEARISDVHAGRLRVGQAARVQLGGGEMLAGAVAQVYPAVEAGVVRLLVNPQPSDHPRLRSNLRVEVHLVVDERADALKLARGAVVRVEGQSAVFVIDGDVARRTPITTGISNFEETEILSGLAEGDEVILSDMTDHAHLEEVKLR